MTVTHIDQSAESLPILNNVGAFISLHFTQPLDEVVVGGSEPGETIDIEELDDEHLDYACGPELAKTAKLSISYDVSAVDDQTAARFMKTLKSCLDDPDLLLLI